jgi:MHS family proline/betaine transporter-like MFS transporter
MSGLSVSYTLAYALFGGTAPFVVLWLVGVTGTSGVAVFYCMGAMLLTLVGGYLIKDRFNRLLQDV